MSRPISSRRRRRLRRQPAPRLASSCRGSAPATKATKRSCFVSDKAAGNGGLSLFGALFDPQIDRRIRSVVELADTFAVALLSVLFGPDLVVCIERNLRKAVRAILLGEEAFHRESF